MASLKEQVLRRKPVLEMELETGADTGKSELKRTVGLWGLSAIGIGGTIGTGIFFILSQAVPIAGPAVIWSFVLSASRRRTDRGVLRRAGGRGSGGRLVVLLCLYHPR